MQEIWILPKLAYAIRKMRTHPSTSVAPELQTNFQQIKPKQKP